MRLVCADGHEVELGPHFSGCPTCSAQLSVELDDDELRAGWDATVSRSAHGIAARVLPGLDRATSLGEGDTPLLDLTGHAPPGTGQVFLKYEGANPTTSFKDRLNAASTAVLTHLGLHGVVASSTGNQAASVAAYAAAAGLQARVFLPYQAPPETRHEILAYGAACEVVPWEQRGRLVRDQLEDPAWGYSGRNWPRPLGSPFGIEGYRSIAHEIFLQLDGRMPDDILMPSCGGDGIAGVARGFDDIVRLGLADRGPRLTGVQAAASPSVFDAWTSGDVEPDPVPLQWSVALSLVDERGGGHGLAYIRASGGTVEAVDDAELMQGVAALARTGVRVEPAGAAGWAALQRGRASHTAHTQARDNVTVVIATASSVRWPVSRHADLFPTQEGSG